MITGVCVENSLVEGNLDLSVPTACRGLPNMNRLDQRHIASRVDLAQSIGDQDTSGSSLRSWSLKPITTFYAGLFGFVCCGAAVIVTASLLALQIQ